MNKTTDPTKLTKLHELDSLLPREIRGQSHALPRIVSAVRRGELGLTKPARPRGSFLLLGARLGEVGYLGGVRERAAEGSLLFDEAEKAHPRVLDILLQLLDAARVTVATGQALDFSGFFIWSRQTSARPN